LETIDPYQKAIHYYNQGLLSLKMIFEDQSNNFDQSVAIDLIKNVEIPVCLNLALCYIKTEKYHYAIKYCSQVLEKNFKAEQVQGGVASLEKALYRRGLSYFKIGDLRKAKADFLRANEIIEEA
jgi:tetratricopeptide (TPR) repeat protein